jgi:hypothetical protein
MSIQLIGPPACFLVVPSRFSDVETPSKSSHLSSRLSQQSLSLRSSQSQPHLSRSQAQPRPSSSPSSSTASSNASSNTTALGLPPHLLQDRSLAQANGGARSFHYSGRRPLNPGDATFLTECSFGVARDHLVELITSVHPFVVNWEEMETVDLEGKRAGSVARLKEFLPRLREANLAGNELDYLSGLPTSVEVLYAAFNRYVSRSI